MFHLPARIVKVTIGLIILFSAFIVLPQLVSADCKENRDCGGGKPYCRKNPPPNGECVECRTPGNSNDCNNPNNVCNENFRCAPKTPTPTPIPPTNTPTPTPTPILVSPEPPQTTGLPNTGTQNVCQMPPADVVIVLDTSSSMHGRMEAAKTGAKRLVTILSENPKNRFAVAQFWQKGGMVGPNSLTNDRAATIARIDGLEARTKDGDKGTCLECAIDRDKSDDDVRATFRNSEFNNFERQRRIVVLFTDGQINHWTQDDGEVVGSTSNQDEIKAHNQAEAAIRRVSQDFDVEFWVLQYGDTGAWGAWLQDTIVGQYNGKGFFDWEGFDEYADGTPYGSVFEAMFQKVGLRILGGYLRIRVFNDLNTDAICYPGDGCTEPLLSGWQVTVRRYLSVIDYTNWFAANYINRYREQTFTTNAQGEVLLNWLCSGQYTVYVTPEPGYEFNTCGPGECDPRTPRVNPRNIYAEDPGRRLDIVEPGQLVSRHFPFIRVATPTPTPTPVPVGSVAGEVYDDTNANGRRDGEPAYTGALQMQLTGNGINQTINTSQGRYSFPSLPAGTFTLKIINVPTGYVFKAPPSGTYIITLTSTGACTVSPDINGYSCQNGDISNLDFGISRLNSWEQISGYNIRNDQSGITNLIPADSSSCSNVMIRDGNGSTPGIAYTAGTNAFGTGRVSRTDWIVSNALIQANSGSGLKTSYTSMESALARNQITPVNLNSYCSDLSNCTITGNIGSQAYKADGNLTLGTVTLGSTNKTVILVNGNLRIRGNISVASGGFLLFAVKGDITVDASVANSGAAVCAGQSATPQLPGVFSTDGNFVVGTAAACPGTRDGQLNIAGSVVTNADMASGGVLVNNRTLCGANAQYPSLTIQPRLDFLLNAPAYMLRPSTIWKEVAP